MIHRGCRRPASSFLLRSLLVAAAPFFFGSCGGCWMRARVVGAAASAVLAPSTPSVILRPGVIVAFASPPSFRSAGAALVLPRRSSFSSSVYSRASFRRSWDLFHYSSSPSLSSVDYSSRACAAASFPIGRLHLLGRTSSVDGMSSSSPPPSPRPKRPRTTTTRASSFPSSNSSSTLRSTKNGGSDDAAPGEKKTESSSSSDPEKPLVIVLAGPTAVGKSAVAAALCRPARASRLLSRLSSGEGGAAAAAGAAAVGHVVSADSVQAYRGVNVGANKPSDEERAATPHHLIDVADPSFEATTDGAYNAAHWVEDAMYVVDRLYGRRTEDEDDDEAVGGEGDDDDDGGKAKADRRKIISDYVDETTTRSSSDDGEGRAPVLPVVVGGTMMYLQWLVHGRPDAPRPSPDALERAARAVAEFQAKDECEKDQEEEKEVNEVGGKASGGDKEEESPPSSKGWDAAVAHASSLGTPFESRAAKLCGKRDWYRLRRILEVAYTVLGEQEGGDAADGDKGGDNDSSKAKAATAAAATEERVKALYSGVRTGGIGTRGGRGYDVRCFFLCPDDRMRHAASIDDRCEDMLLRGLLKETADLSLAGHLPEGGQPARAIGYRQALEYLRRSDAEDGDEEKFDAFVDNFAAVTRRYAKKQMQWFRKDGAFAFVPVALSDGADVRVEAAADVITNMCMLPREEYEDEIRSVELSAADKERIRKGKDIDLFDEGKLTLSQRTKLVNEKQGKGMKLFVAKRHRLVKGSDEYEAVLKEADECTARMRSLDKLSS